MDSQALLSRHNRLNQDIKAFNGEIKRLEELAVLMTKAASEHNVSHSSSSNHSPKEWKVTEMGEIHQI